MTLMDTLRQIVEVAKALAKYGEVVTLDAIAKVHAKKNGSTTAWDDVYDNRHDWIELLRQEGYPVVPMTQYFINHMKAKTEPATVAEKRRCVAGIGWGAKTVAIYRPREGDRDPYARIWQASRLDKKDAKKVIRDLRNQKVSVRRMAELQDGAPESVTLPASISTSKSRAALPPAKTGTTDE